MIYLLGGELSLNISKEEMDNLAASGINELLAGVAWAMEMCIRDSNRSGCVKCGLNPYGEFNEHLSCSTFGIAVL